MEVKINIVKNGLVLSKARSIHNVLPMPSDKFRKQLEENCFVIWSLPNFNSGDLAETPVLPSYGRFAEEKNADIHGALLAAHFEADIWPVVYEDENDGHLIRHVCPMMKSEDKVSSHGGKVDFFPHVDNPDLCITGEEASPHIGICPETLTLLCLRKEEGVNTSLLHLDSVIELLSEKTIETLMQPIFKVERPASFDNRLCIEGVPILTLVKGVWYSRFDWHNTSGLTPEAEVALQQMRIISLDRNLWFHAPLNPGDAITFLNQRTLHTRNAFEPRFDGKDRWLLRVFGLKSRPLNSQLVDPSVCLHHLRTT